MNFHKTTIITFLIIFFVLSCSKNDKTEGMSGTIGKAEKFQGKGKHEILLRSGFIENKDAVENTIASFASFDILMGNTSLDIQDWWIPAVKEYLPVGKSDSISAGLKSYFEFIDNNHSKTLEAIAILSDIKNNEIEYSQDIDQNLISMSDYLNQLMKRNQILVDTYKSIESASREFDSKREIRKFREISSIKDLMLFKTLAVGMICGDKKTIEFIQEQTIENPEILRNIISAKEFLPVHADPRIVFENFHISGNGKLLISYSHQKEAGLCIYNCNELGIHGSKVDPRDIISIFQKTIAPDILNKKEKNKSINDLMIFSITDSKINTNDENLSSIYSFDKLNTDYTNLLCTVMDKEKLNVISENRTLGTIMDKSRINSIYITTNSDENFKLTPDRLNLGILQILQVIGIYSNENDINRL